MTTMHVFVEDDGRLSVAVPKPIVPADGFTGPWFAGVSPGGPSDGIVGYEMEIDEGLLQDIADGSARLAGGSDPFERHVQQLLNRPSRFERVDWLRDSA